MALPTDPLLASQWHLHNPNPALLDLNVFGVWNPVEGLAYTGLGTRTFVLDSGIDFNHPDLAPNYNTVLDFDFETGALSAFGSDTESHGTAVAGIIGAAANGTGAVGVAYQTNLVGYRTAQFINDAWLQDVRDGIHFFATPGRDGDVMNISQGIANDTSSEFGVGYNAVRFDEIEASIGDAVNDGRGGLGATIVKSAGNSRSADYDVNADDWTNDTRQVVVAAVDQNGFVSSYSSYGAAVLVSAFGTPGQVVTTDRVGSAGYNSTDFTSGFNGTSAAAPMVTGVVSLMYDANAGLGWRDVQTILGVSARHVGTDVGFGTGGSERFAWNFNHAETWNGGGQHFSNDYGYGLVDALAAVRLAETWHLTGTAAATTGNQFTNTMDVLNSAVVVPDGNTTGLTFVGNATFDDYVERVTVQMTFSTTFTGDLEVYLTSPDGTVSQLIADTGGGNDFNGTWTFESQAFRGERAAGAWTVRVVDDAGGDTLTVSDIVIRTFGAFSSDDRYIFTNEYSDYAGLFGHDTNVSDANGGIDTVNAAAVGTGSIIRLNGAVSTIDGVAVTFANIENAIGGDGADNIAGGLGNNLIYGMRGADTLTGGNGGTDTVYGGTGNDRIADNDLVNFDFMDGGDGSDTISYANVSFATGVVTIDLAAGLTSVSGGNTETILNFENAWGSQGGETIRGTSGANSILGAGGDDTILGGTGRDTVDGGSGNDRVVDTDFVDFDSYNGGTGTDTIDYSGIAFGNNIVTINLATGLTSVSGGNTESIIAFENIIGSGGAETLRGSTGNNVLRGNAGADSIFGNSGADSIYGDQGADILFGGAGNDTFFFTNKSESTFSAGGTTCDRLRADGANAAFAGAGNAVGDRINLSAIDANESVAGNQAFIFGGAATIGHLQCVTSGSNTSVLGYTNATAGADFQILIEDGAVTAVTYTAADFVL